VAQMQGQNQINLDTIVGSGSYDIGHLFHGQAGGYSGNAGGIYTVCTTGAKGQGYSATSNANGDYFMVDEVAHEMGHQLGATHTFNGINGSCASVAGQPQWTQISAFEPGSGNTIMSYGGTCGTDDIVTSSPPFGAKLPMFSFESIEQIQGF